MAYCANCGSPLNEGQRFCPACGHQAGGEASGAVPSGGAGASAGGAPEAQFVPPLQSPQQQSPQQQSWGPQPAQQPSYQPGHQPGWTYYQQGQGGAPPRRSRKGLWIGLVSAVVVIAVACVLVFVVFRGDIFGGGGASSPEKAVRQFLSAFEDKDVDAAFDLLDPEAMSSVLGGQTVEEAKADMREALFESGDMSSVEFSGIEMSTEETGDDTATVTLTAGKAIITDENGVEDVSDVSEADTPPVIELVRRDGSWYIDPMSMSFLEGAGEDFGDGTSTTDTTDLGPPTTVSGSTTTSEGSTATTIFTTSTAVDGGSGAKTPQEVVMLFFDAMENKDMSALIALFDPVALEELTQGVSLDAFAEMMGESLFDYESVEFSGIQVKVEFQDEANATVTVTDGSVTMTDSDGYTTTEDVRDADEPVVISVIRRDGYWYADTSMFSSGM